MKHQNSSRRWPTTPGGLAGERDWMPVEALVADVLAGLAESGALVEGDGLLLFYLPFTDLGLSEGAALCWEVMLSRDGDVEEIGVGEHPLVALSTLPTVPEAAPAGAGMPGALVPVRSTSAEALQRDWAGWSALLRQAAVVASQGPASLEEPSIAGFTVEVKWSSAPGSPGWVWQSGGMEVLDAGGESVGVRWWQGASPSAALHAALDEVDTWWQIGF